MRAIPILAGVVAGAALAAATYFLFGVFSFGFTHILPEFAFYAFIALWLVSPLVAGVVFGVTTYRMTRAVLAARAEIVQRPK